ncbi:hypothetical protein [Streptomyces sp. NPDC005907]|uniref:hypothetical protein n=1 Tax=Streptomyces sp. NPDC005907 TaxID=3154571 RepID=UPI00340E432B
MRALGGQADGLDDHWTIDSARQGDTVVRTLRGKHPRAHEVSPVVFTLTGIGPLAPEQSEAVRRSLGYGLDEKVVLPRGAVEKVTVTGPEFLGRELENAEVRSSPAEAGPQSHHPGGTRARTHIEGPAGRHAPVQAQHSQGGRRLQRFQREREGQRGRLLGMGGHQQLQPAPASSIRIDRPTLSSPRCLSVPGYEAVMSGGASHPQRPGLPRRARPARQCSDRIGSPGRWSWRLSVE